MRFSSRPISVLALGLSLLAAGGAISQTGATPKQAIAVDTGCCGAISPAGKHLVELLDNMDVEKHWLAHMHVDWKTGHSERFEGMNKPHTHCSAFAAAVGLKLGIYMLRPPDHPQDLLASAQGRWFGKREAREEGWRPVATPREAQTLANQGQLVVLVFINPNPEVPGHIAIVRPTVKTDAALAKEGPQTAQAGLHNFSSGTAVFSFGSHKGAWPQQVLMFAHPPSGAAPVSAGN